MRCQSLVSDEKASGFREAAPIKMVNDIIEMLAGELIQLVDFSVFRR